MHDSDCARLNSYTEFIHCVEVEVIARNTHTRFILCLSLEHMKHGFEKDLEFVLPFKTILERLFFNDLFSEHKSSCTFLRNFGTDFTGSSK